MLVARLLYPVTVLGPGARIGVWVCGCHRRCERCANPELQAFDESRRVPMPVLQNMIASVIGTRSVEGVTITGGEPFEQAPELNRLLAWLSGLVPDILIFSGYTLEALRARSDPDTDGALARAAALVDGEYIDRLNTGSVLRGSDNQRVHILNPAMEARYRQYLAGKRAYQNFATSEGVFAIGLHERGFQEELSHRLDSSHQD